MQTLGATTFHNPVGSNEVVIPFTLQIGECIRLLEVTFEGITLDPPGVNKEPSTGHDEQGAVALFAAEEPL